MPSTAKPGPTATLTAANSDAPFGSSVLLASWNRRRNLHELRPFDPRQGLPLADHEPISMGRNYQYAFSPDGRRLAFVAYPSDMHQRSGVLHLVELNGWQDATTTLIFDGWVSTMSFSPDGTRLAAAYFDERAHPDESVLVMIDLAAQSVVARASLAVLPRMAAFTPDGASLMMYGGQPESAVGVKPIARAALLDAADLSAQWEQPLAGVLDGQERSAEGYEPGVYVSWRPAVILAPDRNTLYIVHAGDERLTTVNFAARSVSSVEIGPAQSWLDWLMALGAGVAHAKSPDGTWKRAALSPDGARLYVVGETGKSSQDSRGQWQFTQTPLNLTVVDAASGVEIATLDTQATDLDLSPDGMRLYLRGYDQIGVPWTDVIDATRLEVVAHLGGHTVIPAQQMDGQLILLSSDSHRGDTTLILLDAQTLAALHSWTTPEYAAWISPLWNPSRR
jgi:dipeptidyl aminopeptidase/acylaminoacyl peptidase